MRASWIRLSCVLLLLGVVAPQPLAAEPSPLTDADRAVFAWFDSIRLPSCAGKPYVRVRWVREGAEDPPLHAADLWEVDGFLVAEEGGTMTLLDGDLWPRKISREPAPGWTGRVEPLELARIARLALGRLVALRTDPGAVEPLDVLYRGVRLRFGDEAQSLALARHCAANGLEQEAHDLLEAARALPPQPDAEEDDLSFQETCALQLEEGVMWRILRDVADPTIARTVLLARARGWLEAFPDAEEVERIEDMERILPGMVKEDAAHTARDDDALAKLPAAKQAAALIHRLRDQGGDVLMDRGGRVGLDLGAEDTPASRLLALGRAAVPALIESLTDERFTRAVMFIHDDHPGRLYVARVGDFARVLLEQITGKTYGDVDPDRPSIFQRGEARRLQQRWRRWLERNPQDAGDAKGAGK